ncbi:acetyl-CoA carboxylase biotin carboxyl carrier protein [Paenibacillus sp. MBLB4367]|uniref:acetyl-CoA carboxylase biotin carboxyl carrier protein n=1 Tax=Paenibacillus sp. MBLB4367 TaxID=3384767 RepID=UPI00390831EF
MFKLSEIKELIKLVDQSSLQEVEIESEGARLLIRKPNKTESVIVASAPAHHTYAPVIQQPAGLPQAGSAVPAAPVEAQAKAVDSNLHKIVSPMVGTFYQAPSPDAAPFVSVGSSVNEKTVVCIVEAMKLMNPLEAEVKGEIVEVLVENGQLVEYGQPLFLVKV